MVVTMKEVTPMLTVKDMDETIDFYTSILGFTLANRMDHWCALSCGDAAVMFTDRTLDPAEPRMTGSLYFNPSDVKALWDSVKDKATVAWELQTMFYDMVEFGIKDCNGYLLLFGQDVSEVAPPLPKRCEE